ncbi:hypothetical protein Tsubulata_033627 [Turnera subulata]|uniref:F-box domain-containing protein n=1 Tax=Turnera subulata TaxID=218843 RepID=A0A9Q0J0V6_9ROSI|nr:hypothetical protein Tsubulata_033627 [Turnera subulata]
MAIINEITSEGDGLPYYVVDDILGKLPAKSMVRFMCISKFLSTNSITLATLQILIRLPAKSLVRFMCLSKSWHNLIRNDPSFKALYNKTSNARQANGYLVQQIIDNGKELNDGLRFELEELGLLEDLRKRKFFQIFSLHHGEDLVEYKSFGTQRMRGPNIPYQNPGNSYHRREDLGKDFVIASHNGLFLMTDSHGLFLWNPSINKAKAIPQLEFPSHWRLQTGGCGVGYCKKDEEDFKIVYFRAQVVHTDDVPQVQEWMVSTYSMSADSWKEIQDIYIPGRSPANTKVVTLDGVPHWIAISWDDKDIIMSFNFDKEEFGHIMSPVPSDAEDVLGNYKGLLSIFRCSSVEYTEATGSRAHYEMWVLKDYGGEPIWTKLFFFQHTVSGELKSMGHNGEVFLNKGHNGKLCTLYDTGEVRKFDIYINNGGYTHDGCIIPYRESLVLLGE